MSDEWRSTLIIKAVIERSGSKARERCRKNKPVAEIRVRVSRDGTNEWTIAAQQARCFRFRLPGNWEPAFVRNFGRELSTVSWPKSFLTDATSSSTSVSSSIPEIIYSSTCPCAELAVWWVVQRTEVARRKRCLKRECQHGRREFVRVAFSLASWSSRLLPEARNTLSCMPRGYYSAHRPHQPRVSFSSEARESGRKKAADQVNARPTGARTLIRGTVSRVLSSFRVKSRRV